MVYYLSCRFSEILEYAPDMEIDIPKFWAYLGEFVGPVVHHGSVSLHFLKDLSKPLMSTDKAAVLVSEVLHYVCHNQVRKSRHPLVQGKAPALKLIPYWVLDSIKHVWPSAWKILARCNFGDLSNWVSL